MSGDTYSLDFAGLEETVIAIGKISNSINSLLEQLESGTLRAILDWESGAREEFDNHRANWSKAAADMSVQAASAQSALSSITGTYSDGEHAAWKLWQGKN
jgi:uncharacterized protein YukE